MAPSPVTKEHSIHRLSVTMCSVLVGASCREQEGLQLTAPIKHPFFTYANILRLGHQMLSLITFKERERERGRESEKEEIERASIY